VEQSAQERRQVHLSSCDQAAANWMSQQAQLDPDWSKKQQLVRREAEAIIRERGLPPTVDDAVKVMKVAKQRVDEQVRSFVPAKKQVEAPVKAGVASTSTAPVPKTALEALNLGLKAARA
jgi:hypothetical protein